MKSIPLIAAIVLTSASISPAVAAPPLIVKGHVLAGFGHRAPSLHSAQTQTAAKQARNLHSTMNMQVAPPEQYTIIDAPDAGTLGLNRALLYNDREGYMETFRPYARPGNDWLEDVAKQLKQ